MKAVDRVLELILQDTSVHGTKYTALDGLRGVAVLTVFFSHSSGFRQRISPWTSFHGLGHIGVYLFFVLSGFLLALSLLGPRKMSLGNFFTRRFLRIAPLFYLIVTVVFLLQIMLGGVDLFNLHIKDSWAGYFKHLIFLQGDSVFWTIAAEFEFYLILPLLCAFLRTTGKSAAWCLTIMAFLYFAYFIAIESGVAPHLPPLKVAHIVHHGQFLDVFLCGVLAAWVWLQPGFSDWWTRHQSALRTLVAGLLVLAIAAGLFLTAENFFGFGRYWRNAQPLWSQWSLPPKFGPASMSLPFGLVFAMLTLGAMHGSGPLQRLFEMRWLRWVGVTGFSWYLVHFPMMRTSNWLVGLPAQAGADISWTFHEIGAWVISFLLTSVVATALYLTVERPSMLLSRNLINRRKLSSP